MDATERFYKIDQMLRNRGVVSVHDFLAVLEVSPATFKRDLQYLRDRLHAPVTWDREKRGYRFTDPDPAAPRYQLPGLWFNDTEIHALLTMHHLLENLQPGLLGPHIEPLKQRIKALLERTDNSAEEVMMRIRVLPLAARKVEPQCFQVISHALLRRCRLFIRHYNRVRNEETEREISPQRLVHYRDNWYLDAWDHGKNALRSFAVDTVRGARLIDKQTKNIAEKTLDAELSAGYGIFAGRKTQWAKLRFSPERARWVAQEQWHPKQKSHFEVQGRTNVAGIRTMGATEDGYYILEIPYSDDRELLMDILKHGPEVEVLSPKSLRTTAQEQLRRAAHLYEK